MNNTSKDIAGVLVALTKAPLPTVDPLNPSILIPAEKPKYLPLVLGQNLFVGQEPATPISCVTIFDVPPWWPILCLDGSSGYERPAIQIRVRNPSYETGMLIAQDIVCLLHGKNNFTQAGTDYLGIQCVSSPHLLDWDSNNLSRVIIQFDIQRRN